MGGWMSDGIDCGCLLPAPNSKDLHRHNQVNTHILMERNMSNIFCFLIQNLKKKTAKIFHKT
jgi:hypothetical protein